MNPSSRRDFLKAGLYGAGAVSLSLTSYRQVWGATRSNALRELMGPLAPVADETTGLPLLLLPDGFRYHTFSWAGSLMHDGHIVPGQTDGMGRVMERDGRVTLIRNHELTGSSGPIGPARSSYDVTGGGTTTLVFDLGKEQLVDSWVSLSGTLRNCAGGVTPWGSWLSCEEAVTAPGMRYWPILDTQFQWDVENAVKPHGFVFEVPASGLAQPSPLHSMGQFHHEAASIDPRTGIVYMTEDLSPRAGFYRFVPEQPGQLAAGGQLQMMKVDRGRDMRDALIPKQKLPVEWVPIEQPEMGFRPGSRAGDGVVSQGLAAGGSAFVALEGCGHHDGRIFFTSKRGGAANAGYVFEYDPQSEQVWLIYESPGHDAISGPDNIIMSPRGSLLICEDRLNWNKAAQSLDGLTADGTLFRFCQVNPDLDAIYAGHDLGRTTRKSEWAGVAFSENGDWLFCNLYLPGFSLAIAGPWQEGLV